MNTPGRILATIVVAILLLALALLEMVSERVRVEPPITEPSPAHLADLEVWEGSGSTLAVPQEIERIEAPRNGRPADAGLKR